MVVTRKRRIRPEYLEFLEKRTLFSFGLTTTSSTYIVDTGASLVFTVARTAPSGGSVGDLMSMKYNGTELEAPFATSSRYSHYESGLSSATVVTATTDPNGQWIKITCDDTGSTGVGVIHYYIAHKGDPNIYMADYSPGPSSPSPGEMRFITYTNPSILTNIPAPSNNNGSTGAIESSDVFGHADGTTTSKYYGEHRAIDAQTYGVTGGGFGLYMNIGNRETSSGGPFFKDIDFQNNELYTYTYSGHSQTENFRSGLKGPYALQFTTGATPAAPDYSFVEGLGLTGYVPSAQRGTVSGTASGVASGLQATVALSNATAQYWALPDPTTGAYTISGVIAGTYTETLYQGELAVGSVQVTVSGGAITRQNITSTNAYSEIDQNSNAVTTPALTNQIFRIGTWDGTPIGFNNADKITDMHPTDVRMNPWAADATGVTNFTVGTDPDSAFPMAAWHTQVGTGAAGSPYADTDNRITFTLTAAQAATPLTLRIGLTRLDHGRPTIKINGTSSSVPNIASQPNSRGLTTGNWRGNNCIYTFNISTSSLVAGTNTLDIYCTSGSTGTWYSGYQVYDAIDLVPTSSLTNAPVLTSIQVSPSPTTVAENQQQTFTAQAFNQFGNPMPANFTWSAANGTVDGTGLYTAPSTHGSDALTVISGTVSGTASISVNSAPTVATASSPATSPVTTTSTTLSVLGADDGGESNLTYSWATLGTPPAAVNFSINGTNAAKNATASFTHAGTYNFQVTITDSHGLSTTSSTSVTVLPNVFNLNDSGAGSLRQAITDANAASSAQTITFASNLSGAVSLASALPAISNSLTLGAPGISLGGAGTLLTVNSGITLLLQDVTLASGSLANNGTLQIAGTTTLNQLTGSGALAIGTPSTPAILRLGNSAGASSTGSLAINSGEGGSTLDIANDDFLINFGSPSGDPTAAIVPLLAAGQSGGWTGAGIISSMAASNSHLAIGYADGNTDGIAAPNQLLLRTTVVGDANLDGKVDVIDLGVLATNYGTSGQDWAHASFNYDANVDVIDLGILATNYGLSLSTLGFALVQSATPSTTTAASTATAPTLAPITDTSTTGTSVTTTTTTTTTTTATSTTALSTSIPSLHPAPPRNPHSLPLPRTPATYHLPIQSKLPPAADPLQGILDSTI